MSVLLEFPVLSQLSFRCIFHSVSSQNPVSSVHVRILFRLQMTNTSGFHKCACSTGSNIFPEYLAASFCSPQTTFHTLMFHYKTMQFVLQNYSDSDSQYRKSEHLPQQMKYQLLFHLCTMAADNPDPADTFLSMPSDYQSLQQSVAGHGTRLLYRQQKNLPQTVPVFLFVLPSLFAAI